VGRLLDQFQAVGIAFAPLPGGRLNATGQIDDNARAAIRAHKAAILAELSAANDAATPEQAAELRELIALILANESEADRPEALAVALADPDAALTCFRALAADIGSNTRRPARVPVTDDRRPCTDCTNLTARDHRCLAAWRGERPGGAARDYHRVIDLPRRCECFAPKPAESDQRNGPQR